MLGQSFTPSSRLTGSTGRSSANERKMRTRRDQRAYFAGAEFTAQARNKKVLAMQIEVAVGNERVEFGQTAEIDARINARV